jgi:hypothetical protein
VKYDILCLGSLGLANVYGRVFFNFNDQVIKKFDFNIFKRIIKNKELVIFVKNRYIFSKFHVLVNAL